MTSTARGLFYYKGRTFLDSFTGIPIEWLKKPWRKVGDAPAFLLVTEPRGPVASSGTPWRPGGSGFGVRQVCNVGVYYEMAGTESGHKDNGEQ